jgi:hypothetical protein
MTFMDPLPERCDCGQPVEPCAGGAAPRCTAGEPNVSEDCTVVFARAS